MILSYPIPGNSDRGSVRQTSMQRFPLSCLAVCALSAAVLPFAALPAVAGLDGQPQPTPVLKVQLSNAAQWITRSTGKVGQARADFLLLLDKSPTADITEVIAPALSDTGAYQSIVATFSDALDAAADSQTKQFLRYNIARTHLLRARLTPVSAGKNPYAEAAARTVAEMDAKSRDPAYWELKGDVEAEQGDLVTSAADYQKMTTLGGSAAVASYKYAMALQKARRYPEAEAAYQRAVQRDAASTTGGGETYHLIYQGLAGFYSERGDFPSALNALTRSTRIKSETPPFALRLDTARALLKRGYKKEVAAYAEAALKRTPSDTGAAALLKEAGN